MKQLWTSLLILGAAWHSAAAKPAPPTQPAGRDALTPLQVTASSTLAAPVDRYAPWRVVDYDQKDNLDRRTGPRFIGRIGLYDESSTIELPAGMPAEAANALKRTRVRGVPINLRIDEGRPDSSFGGERRFKKKFSDG